MADAAYLPPARVLDILEAFGSHFVSDGTIKCIVAYGETSETRWRRPWFCTLNDSSLVYLGHYLQQALSLSTKRHQEWAIVRLC